MTVPHESAKSTPHWRICLRFCKSPWLFWMAVGLLGLLIGLCLIGSETIRASANEQDWLIDGDKLNGIIGLNYYVQDDWRLPLFEVKNLDYPSGANIIFTDSIPLIAPLLKIGYAFTGTLIDPFGPWLLLCFILQAVSGVIVLRQAGVCDRGVLLTAGILACSLPALPYRFGHVALCSHFTLVLAIALYLRSRRVNWNAMQTLWLSTVLLCATLFIHAYLWSMVAAIAGVTALGCLLQHRISRTQFLAWGTGTGAATLGLMLLSGYVRLDGASTGGSGGFGYFSMNLLSPFWPHLSGLFPLQVANADATGGQYEGYNYLGAGIILLLIGCVILARKSIPDLLRRHWLLILFCVGFTGFALSPKVYLGQTLLFEAGIPKFIENLFGTFRSSGRYFWPVAYILVLGAIAVLVRQRPRLALPLLSAVVVVQFLDLRYFYRITDEHPRRPAELVDMRNDLRNLIRQHSVVYVAPTYADMQNERQQLLEILHLASLENIPITEAYLARPLRKRLVVSEKVDELISVRSNPDWLFVLAPPFNDNSALALLGEPVYRWNGLLLKGNDVRAFVSKHGGAYVRARSFPEGETVPASQLGTWFVDHFSPIHEATWTEGDVLHGFIPIRGTETTLQIAFHPLLSPSHTPVTATTYVNGIMRGESHWTWPDADLRHIPIPLEPAAAGDIAYVRIETNPVTSPRKAGIGKDSRKLALWVKEARLDSTMDSHLSEVTTVRYVYGSPLRFHAPHQSPTPWFSGLSGPEDPGTWTDGPVVAAAIPLQHPPSGDLLLTIEGYPFAHPAHEPISVRVNVNGSPVAEWHLDINVTRYRARIPSAVVQGRDQLDILLEINRPGVPKDLGLNPDTRALGLMLRTFVIDEAL